jgi:beta-lactamase superfamily II metal-dependent hydrolase
LLYGFMLDGEGLPVLSKIRIAQYVFGHVSHSWRDSGAQVMTTGEHGAITVSTDGEDLRVETFVRP